MSASSPNRSWRVRLSQLTACLLVAASVSHASAVRIFLSSSETNPLATDGLTLLPEQSADLFIWIEPDAYSKVNGAAFDLVADTGLLSATSVDIFNPDVLGQPRWQGTSGPRAGDLNSHGKLVENSVAVAVTSSGIDGALAGSGFDPFEINGAFLHGMITVQAGQFGGATQVSASPNGRNPLTVRGQSGGTRFDAPSFRIEVDGPPKPAMEPADDPIAPPPATPVEPEPGVQPNPVDREPLLLDGEVLSPVNAPVRIALDVDPARTLPVISIATAIDIVAPWQRPLTIDLNALDFDGSKIASTLDSTDLFERLGFSELSLAPTAISPRGVDPVTLDLGDCPDPLFCAFPVTSDLAANLPDFSTGAALNMVGATDWQFDHAVGGIPEPAALCLAGLVLWGTLMGRPNRID